MNYKYFIFIFIMSDGIEERIMKMINGGMIDPDKDKIILLRYDQRKSPKIGEMTYKEVPWNKLYVHPLGKVCYSFVSGKGDKHLKIGDKNISNEICNSLEKSGVPHSKISVEY